MAAKILVVDDNHLVTKTLARLLEKEGYSVNTAETCQEALTKVEQTGLDLIISDIRMPDTDGIEMARKANNLLKEKGKKELPIIFITGYSDEASHQNALKLHPADFIYKPFDKEEFLASVAKALRGF